MISKKYKEKISLFFMVFPIIAIILSIIVLVVVINKPVGNITPNIPLSDSSRETFEYQDKTFSATQLQKGWILRTPVNHIYWDKTNLHGIIFGNYLSYYKYDTTPKVFYSDKDSASVYYVCTEEFEYPVIQEDLPDEIFIECLQDSVEITVTDKTEIENIVNNISSDMKLSEFISHPDICNCTDIEVLARWDTFPLEFSLTALFD